MTNTKGNGGASPFLDTAFAAHRSTRDPSSDDALMLDRVSIAAAELVRTYAFRSLTKPFRRNV
jgi:hypothetical protein